MISGSSPAYQFVMEVLELGGFHRLPRRPFWHRLLEPASSRTSFLVGGQVRSVMLTLTSARSVDSIQICPREKPLKREGMEHAVSAGRIKSAACMLHGAVPYGTIACSFI